jgi:hypothetical protein
MFSFPIRSVVTNFELDSPKTFQMDRRWITGCTGFTTDHEKRVKDFLAHFFEQDTLRMKK